MLSRKKIQEGLELSGMKQVFIHAYHINWLGQNMTGLKLHLECFRPTYRLL
jgi:hypothetical protein